MLHVHSSVLVSQKQRSRNPAARVLYASPSTAVEEESPTVRVISEDAFTVTENELRMRDKRTNFGWTTEYRLPNGWTLAGHSEGREATGFVLVEPRIFLDAGIRCRKWTPHAILVTHAHQDHVGELPALIDRNTIVCTPSGVLPGIYAYVAAGRMQKRTDRKDSWLRPLPEQLQAGDSPFEDGLAVWCPMKPGSKMPLHLATLRSRLPVAKTQHPFSERPPPRAAHEDGISDTPQLDKNCENIIVRAVACVHSTEDVGYILCEMRRKLRPEFSGLDGKTLGAMSKAGTVLQHDVEVPVLAYICDTSIEIFDDPTTAEAILACPTVMIESNFLEQEMEGEAKKRGHICWSQLSAVVARHPEVTFILFHYSQRYRTNAQIKAFFASQTFRPSNVRLWLTGEVVSIA